mmetsp:Transcript_20520/g.29766  ORF Transcript_20520/g.29766 Transcript_20520/m.29766 type:complete len:298 (+) Transcript_20520:116-1009(+)
MILLYLTTLSVLLGCSCAFATRSFIGSHNTLYRQNRSLGSERLSELRGGNDADLIKKDENIEFFTLQGGMCPYAARTLIVLHELGLQFDTVEVSGRPKPDWYLEINPRGKVPAIRVPSDKNTIVYESAICDEYLCDYYDLSVGGDRNLMPRAPSERANIRLLNDHYDTVVGPAQFTFLMNKDSEKDEELENAMEKSLDVYEETLKNSGGPFLIGESFTLADVHILPFVLRLIVSLRHFKSYELPRKRYPLLLRWYELCSARKSVQEAARSEERIIEVYKMFVERDYAFGGLNKNGKT